MNLLRGSSDHDLIGRFNVALDQVLKEGKRDFLVIHPKKQLEKKHYENSGVFHFDNVSFRNEEIFVDNPLHTEWLTYRAFLAEKDQREKDLLVREQALSTGIIPSDRNPFT